MTLSPQASICRRADVLTSHVGDETVMLDVEKGYYYGLDPVATRVWDLAAEPIVVTTLCERLTAEFDVDLATCTQDVLAFLESLHANGLLDVSET